MITVCVNGFIAMGQTANGDFGIIIFQEDMTSPMIAPFWMI
jgi:hypothetical protein